MIDCRKTGGAGRNRRNPVAGAQGALLADATREP